MRATEWTFDAPDQPGPLRVTVETAPDCPFPPRALAALQVFDARSARGLPPWHLDGTLAPAR